MAKVMKSALASMGRTVKSSLRMVKRRRKSNL